MPNDNVLSSRVLNRILRDNVEKNLIKLEFINTELQIADIFTKPLCRKRFEILRSKLGMMRIDQQ